MGRLRALGDCIAWLFCLVLTGVLASEAAAQGDVEGSVDHPLVKRYEGSVIIGYDTREFDEFDVPLGPPNGYEPELTRKKTVEGRRTRIIYVAPDGRSTLEVFRNYENSLREDRFKTLFQCRAGGCSVSEGAALVNRVLYPIGGRLQNRGQVTEMAFSFPKEVRYMSAELNRPAGDVYVSLYVARENFNHFPETDNRVLVLLDIIEEAAMEERMVSVNAEEMAQDIAETGRVTLYGIYFDSGSTTINPESKETLGEIAKLLKNESSLKLYVVGHTDSVGGFESNMDLSGRRALSVVSELVRIHGVDKSRLKPAGVGLLAPVASNDTDEGRAKNRRVELVKQ